MRIVTIYEHRFTVAVTCRRKLPRALEVEPGAIGAGVARPPRAQREDLLALDLDAFSVQDRGRLPAGGSLAQCLDRLVVARDQDGGRLEGGEGGGRLAHAPRD